MENKNLEHMNRYAELYVESAMLAGELLLRSGAEIHRVEDTTKRILVHSGMGVPEVFALTTGLFVSLMADGREPVTVVRRIDGHSTNLRKIIGVNSVSRRICSDEISIEEAYEELKTLKERHKFSLGRQCLANALVCSFFAIMFGGGIGDFLVSGLIGALLGIMFCALYRVDINDFCQTALAAFLVGSVAIIAGYLGGGFGRSFGGNFLNYNTVIVASIMPMVPGVAFTTSIRDMLNGDYSSGLSRMAEALVVGLAVAFGVGIAITVFGKAGGML